MSTRSAILCVSLLAWQASCQVRTALALTIDTSSQAARPLELVVLVPAERMRRNIRRLYDKRQQSDTTSGSSSTSSSSQSSDSTSQNSSSSPVSSSGSSASSNSNSSTQSTNSGSSSSSSDTSSTPSSTSSTFSSDTSSTATSVFQSSAPSPISVTPTLPTHISPSKSQDLTTIFSSVVTTINGQLTTIYTAIPTTLDSQDDFVSNSPQHSIILGGAIGGGLLFLLLIIGGFFLWRCQSRWLANAHRRLQQPHNLQHGYDDFDLVAPDMSEIFNPTALYDGGFAPAPMLLRPRGSETGSIFQENDVWPPPRPGSQLQDPILASSEVDLSGIVDNVMGSSDNIPGTVASRHRSSSPSWTSAGSPNQRYSHVQESTGNSASGLLASQQHSRLTSVGSPRARASPLALVTAESPESTPLHSPLNTTERKALEAHTERVQSAYSSLHGRSWSHSSEPFIHPHRSSTMTGSSRPFSPESQLGATASTSQLVDVGSMTLPDIPTGSLFADAQHDDAADSDIEIPPLYHTIRRDTDPSIESHT